MPDTPATETDGVARAYQALHDGAAVRLARDVLRASGPDATGYLQGQLSQDVAALAEGGSAWTWVLQPAGKVDALVRISRVGADDFVLDVDGDWGEAVQGRLNRFKLRMRVDIEPLAWSVLALRGTAVTELVAAGTIARAAADLLVVDVPGPGLAGVDLLGAHPAPPAGLSEVDPEVWEVARIEAGVPKMGAELTERTIPAETGLVAETVSFTKGCYTGQELVARIDSRGSHVAKHLRGLLLDGPAATGSGLSVGEKSVGTVTSVARSPVRGWVGLGYVSRTVEPGQTVQAGDEQVAARVVALPFGP